MQPPKTRANVGASKGKYQKAPRGRDKVGQNELRTSTYSSFREKPEKDKSRDRALKQDN